LLFYFPPDLFTLGSLVQQTVKFIIHAELDVKHFVLAGLDLLKKYLHAAPDG